MCLIWSLFLFRQVISQQSVQELVRSQQQGGATVVTSQSQPTVVVTSHLPVVSVGSLTPTQLAQTLVKQAGGSKTVTQAVGTTQGGLPTSRLTPQQINILKQQALMRKKNDNNKQVSQSFSSKFHH